MNAPLAPPPSATLAPPPGGTLMLVHRIPFPPDRGDKIRSFHMLKALAAIGPVHLAAFADDAQDMAHADALAPWTASRCIVERRPNRLRTGARSLLRRSPLSVELFDHPRIRAYVRARLASGDIARIFAFSGQMAHFVPASFSGPFVMDFVDVDSAKFEAYATAESRLHPMRYVHAREARLLASFEARTARRADTSLLVSADEAALFQARVGAGARQIMAIGNGVDLDFFNPAARISAPADALPSPAIIFTGQMDYRPNVEAVREFAHNCLPAIRREYPAACFAIVGRSPTADVRALAQQPGVRVTGAVDDVRGWLAAADIVVAPLLIARGIQNKVLEAMAMARPVVASPAAAQGIDAEAGRDLIIAEPGRAMAAAITTLLDRPARMQALGAAARNQMVSRYSWEKQLAPLATLFEAG